MITKTTDDFWQSRLGSVILGIAIGFFVGVLFMRLT